MNHSELRLRDRNEIAELMATPGFFEYAWPIYRYLENMKPGQVIKLVTTPDRLPWLVKTVCIFYISEGHWKEYGFNNDMTKFRRERIPVDYKNTHKRG